MQPILTTHLNLHKVSRTPEPPGLVAPALDGVSQIEGASPSQRATNRRRGVGGKGGKGETCERKKNRRRGEEINEKIRKR